jgi:hypothetical protein
MLLALGDASRECATGFGNNARFYERIQELLADLENHLTPDTTVLVKGSRFMQMERVVKSFEVTLSPNSLPEGERDAGSLRENLFGQEGEK